MVLAVVLLSLVGVLDDGSDSGSMAGLSAADVAIDSFGSHADNADDDRGCKGEDEGLSGDILSGLSERGRKLLSKIFTPSVPGGPVKGP